MPSKMSLDELHEKFDTHLKNQSEKWKSLIYAKEKGFYQGFDELEIDGWRPTEKRFTDYDIDTKPALSIFHCYSFSSVRQESNHSKIIKI